MSRSAALAVAVLLLTAGVAPAVAVDASPAPAPSPATATQAADDALTASTAEEDALTASTPEEDAASPANNTTQRLPITGPVTENYSTVELDFGASMALSNERVASQYQVSLVELQLEQVQTERARGAIVGEYLDATVEELTALNAAEERAVARYRQGEISAETLLVKFAMIDRRARAIDDSLARIENAGTPLTRSTRDRIRNVDLGLDSFNTPARRHVALAATGELKGGVNPLHVAASDQGVAVEMLDGGEYHRNAIRFDNRMSGGVDQFEDYVDFQNRVNELYPWARSSFQGGISIDVYPGWNLYRATGRHPQGSLTVYADGATRDVYRETQVLLLDRLPELETVRAIRENVSVSVTPTASGGPVLVNVTRLAVGNESATPLDAVVRVNDHTVGRTGGDGTIWLLPPSEGDYEVRVVQDGTSINVTVPN
ncbi:DUF7094 domain-containing protein [Halorubellus salinus]|uniref:DUF7094 domain-containing protein n=1 Tax=Halorubellus salinus TaxID=755309 RepID=UPI001D088001|nr:hypothetical protein [Halorubellus salinus]